MTSTTRSTQDRTFSQQLRDDTRRDHEQAERSAFVEDLFGGRLPVEAYAGLLAQLWFVYDALEGANAAMDSDAVAGGFVDPALDRLPALEADLVHLGLGVPAAGDAFAATTRYADRIREVGATWPGGWIAHHYTRYLGDLSGGQAIRVVVRREYGLGPDGGTAFYDFAAIDDRRAYKDRYRARLDAVPWDDAARAAVAEEASAAFAHNTALFGDLAARFAPS